MNLSQRMERLERENRRLKRSGIAALLVLGLVLVMGQAAGAPDEIKAYRFSVVDQEGTVRAGLGMGEEGPLLGLSDANGKSRVVLHARPEGPALGLADAHGMVRAVLGVREDDSELMLLDANGTMRVALVLKETGSALNLFDAKETLRISLDTATDSAGVELFDDEGQPRAGLMVVKRDPLLFAARKGERMWKAP